MNLKQLEYFVSVAELGSFSKAALALDMAQPALSRQVRALEVELRDTLLVRNGRGVTLTEAQVSEVHRRLEAHVARQAAYPKWATPAEVTATIRAVAGG